MTVRLTIEIQGIPYENLEPLVAEVEAAGLVTGGTGSIVRPVVACKGTVCVHGLFDTQAFAKRIYDEFFVGWHSVTLPHKFKIAVGGCPNNCVKPGLNDFGVYGQSVPEYDARQVPQLRQVRRHRALSRTLRLHAAPPASSSSTGISARTAASASRPARSHSFSEKERGYAVVHRRHLGQDPAPRQ